MDQHILRTQRYEDVITYPYHNPILSMLIKENTKLPHRHMLLRHWEQRSRYTGAPFTNKVCAN